MEESNEEHRVVPELYFLIAKFLSGGPLKETAKTLLKELERVEVLPRRLDWEGTEHTQSYNELSSQYSDMSWRRLASVCERALSLAQVAPSLSLPAGPSAPGTEQLRLTARLSLLSESLVRPRPKYASYKQDHTLVRRVISRETGSGAGGAGAGAGAVFPSRLLRGLRLQRRTLGHLSAVYCLVFDCTGRYVITGADDLLVKVWSALDGRLCATLRGAAAEITDVCVSADGALVACGSVERLVRVWCLASGAPRAVLHAHAGTITSVHWAPPARTDVRWLASTSTDGSVAFWTCSPDGQFLSQPVQYVERMRPGACHMICAAWSAGGAFLAAGSADQHVRLYTVEHDPGGPRRVLETAVHGDAVDSIAWAHRGLRFVSGSKDGSAALWTLHATQWRHVLLLPTDNQASDAKRLKVTMVCWDCSDAYVITAVSDYTVRVWDSRSCQQVRSLGGHRDEAYVLEAHPFLPGVILSAGHDGQLFVWDVAEGEVLCQFHNHIEGQGDGAIFDAKWGGAGAGAGATIAASDSHGHLLLLGLGEGHRLLRTLPTELFFHTDYRPLVRDALGGALDEQTELPPHLMPPPFLVDVEGAPHSPQHQRLVPGRENLALSQLIPAADAARSRNQLDLMIEALAAARTPPHHHPTQHDHDHAGEPARGVWRGEGVRHTAGSWQSGDPQLVPASTRAIVPPLSPAARLAIEQASCELNAMEQSWYRREMRRRPLMISTAIDAGPRRRPGRRPARPPPRPRPRPRPATQVQLVEEPPESVTSDTSESSGSGSASVRLSARSSRARTDRGSSLDLDLDLDLTTDDTSHSGSKSNDSASSQYSDWEAGAALAPPARARRKPLPTNRYSPSVTPSKRPERAAPSASAAASLSAHPSPPPAGGGPAAPGELAEVYRPGEWLTAVSPRKAPYHPQMGDDCLYFRLGHQRYFEAVAEKDLYKVNPRDKPWERTHVYECEMVKVVGIKYVIKPPRVVCLRLACTLEGRARSLTVRYHDMPDVIDFLVLRQQYECATARHWGAGDRFRCMIDDSWWTGVVLERVGPGPGGGVAGEAAGPGPAAGPGQAEAARWAAAAAAHFLSLRVRWDNGEVERLSPWDLEPLDPARLPPEPGGCVPVLSAELEAALYRADPAEWGRGDRAAACRQIAQHISQVMTLSVAEPFVAPVDLQQYPLYARMVPYPIDLATIRARFENQWYRRTAAAQFDVRYLATNAEHFNQPHSPIVRQARLITDLLLHIISHWRDVNVVAKYHELAAAYHSSDDEPLALSHSKSRRGASGAKARREAAWREACEGVLRDLMSSHDAEPFRHPVEPDQAPDYQAVVPRPMDLGSVRARLAAGAGAGAGGYSAPGQFAHDVRLIFANSRLYNTNKRSRIYSMTVRLSALFETLWSRVPTSAATRPAHAHTHAHTRRHRRTRTRTRARDATNGRPTRRTRRLARTAETQNGDLSPAATLPLGTIKSGACPSHSQSQSPADSSDSETLAATSRRVHAPRDRDRNRDDSSDSDAPLYKPRKGKGVGKKSKSSSASADPGPAHGGPHTHTLHDNMSERQGSGSEEWCSLEVVEQELAEELVELTYDEEPTELHQRGVTRSRKRVLSGSASGSHSAGGGHSGSGTTSGSEWRRPTQRRHKHKYAHKHKRIRERFTTQSSSSPSSSGSEGGRGRGRGAGHDPDTRRYESDHSYRPRYSTDDDAPLHLYRQRSGLEGGEEAGPSTSTSRSRRERNAHGRSGGDGGGGGVSLRARRPHRYNEDSEEDSVAAISKRLQHHHHHQQQADQRRRHHHAAQSVASLGGGRPGAGPSAGGGAGAGAGATHTADHNYYNGHQHNNNRTHNGTGGASGGSTNSGPATVSISSRGRVRKLTAKARGLLRD